MTKLTIKIIKGNKYAYMEKSIRVGKTVRKISKYLGPYHKIKHKKLWGSEPLPEYNQELLQKEIDFRTRQMQAKGTPFQYPLTLEEVRKIEEMNLKYKKIIGQLHPKDVEDLQKRFIANYVFESNALEGNSLTLKNVVEVIFENRISTGKDLREIYDAQNSYALFIWLQGLRKKITDDFIIDIHSKLMYNIDDRLGYRTVPVVLFGKPTTILSPPEKVKSDMDNLLRWYGGHEERLHPLELAFQFHFRFEKIHPFADGNGRVGRFLLNYILLHQGYFPIIIRKTSRNSYLKALDAADRGIYLVLLRFALKHYKETFRKFFEMYVKYVT